MSRNLYLPRLFVNHRGLFVLGLVVYWVVVLVVSFRGHAGTELSDIEMMKKIGGQSNYGYCQARTMCKDRQCPSCTDAQLNGPCKESSTINAVGQIGYYPESCYTDGNLETCLVTGQSTKALCIEYYPCNCQNPNGFPECVRGDVNSNQCVAIDAGVTCTYTPCP